MTKRHALTVCSWNVGAGVFKDAARIIEQERPAALALQEASDQAGLVKAICEEFGYLPISFGLSGAPATPAIYDPQRARVRRAHWHPFIKAGTKVGRGTGPDRLPKDKGALVLDFEHIATGRRIVLANLHLLAGQKPFNRRQNLSRSIVEDTLAVVEGHPGIKVVLGDMNTDPDRRAVKPLRKAGWSCNHDERRLATHGDNWSPDQVWWRSRRPTGERDDRIRYVGHHTIGGTGSDHRPLVVDFELTERVR